MDSDQKQFGAQMVSTSKETIFALASGGLPSGVAVVRISGPAVCTVMDAILPSTPKPREAVLQKIRHPQSGDLLDEGLVLFFEGPSSFTGEDVLELHCHGGVASVAAVLGALGELSNLRLAEAGEFSRRAFENGRMDLTELEGLSDLISAQTDAQRKLALSQSGGSLRTLYDDWRTRLIKARALIEAELDFSDEEDVPGSVSDQVWEQAALLNAEISAHLDDGRSGEIVRRGFRIALMGPPNAGKSSLLNALAKRDVAIVTPQAGTTRDVIDVSLDLGGNLVIVSDTAGLRDADDVVEQEGIRRAKAAAEEADLVLWLQAVDQPVTAPSIENGVILQTKTDLSDTAVGPALSINTQSPEGIAPLLSWLETVLSHHKTPREEPILTRQRHREALGSCQQNLQQAAEPLELEVRSEYLRLAADALGRITGRIDVEDLLDVIFSEFCVGK